MADAVEVRCAYGLAPDALGACVLTLSSFCRKEYRLTQYIYTIFGAIALLAAGYKYWQAVRNSGTLLQKQSFLLCMYGAVTFVLRAIDPKSYGHILPLAVSSFFSYSCTDALVTVFILSLFYWVCLVQGIPSYMGSLRFKLCKRIPIAFIWSFDLFATMTNFRDKGFGGISRVAQLYVSAAYIGVVSSMFMFYGIKILQRLNSISRFAATQPVSRENASVYSMDIQDIDEIVEPTKKSKPSMRIYKVLIVTETISLVTIVSQIYIARSRQTHSWTERDCANGLNCQSIDTKIQPLHCYQYACLWAILWTFRRTEKRGDLG